MICQILRRARRDQELARARDLRAKAASHWTEARACYLADNLPGAIHYETLADQCIREARELEGRA
jgi:hypothetical protein